MNTFLIDYLEKQNGKFKQLTTVITMFIDLNNPQYSFLPQTFTSLNFEHNFQEMIRCLVSQIMNYQLAFKNITLIAINNEFFKIVLPRECKIRKIELPHCLTNYIDIQECFRKNYNKNQDYTLQKIAQFFGQFRNIDRLTLLKHVAIKISQDQLLFPTYNLEDPSTTKLQYFSIIGLPFNVTKNQLLQLLFPQNVNRNKIQIKFTQQSDGRFSGNAVLQCHQELAHFVESKNKAKIGSRYIQVFKIGKQSFQQQSQKQYKDKNIQNRNYINKEERYHPPRSRSRQRKDRSKSSQSPLSNNRKDSIFYKAIRIRGLPFSYSANQLENLFIKYNSIKKSAKMGHKNGRRSGQAMLLVSDQLCAQKSLSLNGVYIGGRYIQVMLARMEQYDRFT